jgi:Flp pilus assembly protein TadG
VEFAMVFPIIVFMLLGLFDLGRAVYSYNSLAQAARSASRLAIVNQNVANVKNNAIAAAPTLGLTAANVDVCFKTSSSTLTNCSSSSDNCPQSTRVLGCLAIVRANLTYHPMTPVISLIWSNIALSSTSIASIEYVCPTGSATACP